MTARWRRLARRSHNEPMFPEPFDCPCCLGGVYGGPAEVLAHVAANIPELVWRWAPAVDEWMLVGERRVAVAEVAADVAWGRAA